MSNCNVSFFKDVKDNKGTGHSKNYDGPQSVPDLEEVHWQNEDNDNMKDDISWIDTSSEAWIRIYSKPNYQGRTTVIGPGQHVSMKTTYDENNEDDMDNTIESFQLYNHKPDINTTNITNNLVALYPGAIRTQLHNRYVCEWYAQDSHYRIYDPSILLTTDKISFTIDLDHIQAESDDHAMVTFSMNLQGEFVDHIQVTYDIAKATQIPDWAIKLIDGAIEVTKYAAIAIADGAEIILTDGIGVVAVVETNKLIKNTAKALTFCVDHLNFVLNTIFKFQDDGGTTNFPAIVSHSIGRLILSTYQELYGPDKNTLLGFNEQNFRGEFSVNAWQNSRKNPFIEFTLGAYDYRTYYPDNTFLYARGGTISSVKISAITDFQKDDHMILQAIFDPKGKLFSVTGCMDIFLINNPDDYTAPSSGVLTYNASKQIIHIPLGKEEVTIINNYDSLESAFADMMAKSLSNTAVQYDVSISGQQISLVDASLKVLAAITRAVN